MSTHRRPPTSIPSADELRFTVRQTLSSACLVKDETTGWRWSDPSLATPMTRAEADAAAARMGGVVCVDGVQVDKIGVVPPKRPRRVKGGEPPKEAKAAAIRAHVAAGRWREAIRLGAKLKGLGEDSKTLARAWDGLTRPAFCREFGRDPEALVEAGKVVLRRRFG